MDFKKSYNGCWTLEFSKVRINFLYDPEEIALRISHNGAYYYLGISFLF